MNDSTEKKPSPFNCQYAFCVEGSLDQDFVEFIIKNILEEKKVKFDKNFFQVKKLGGKSHFNYENVARYLEVTSLPKKLILINDADHPSKSQSNQSAGHEEVKKNLQDLALKLNNKYEGHNMMIAHYIMPFNKKGDCGELEDLFLKSLKSEYQKKVKCISNLEDCLKKSNPKPKIEGNYKISKIRAEVLINYFNMKKDLGEFIDYNHNKLCDLKNFLLEIFNLNDKNKSKSKTKLNKS